MYHRHASIGEAARSISTCRNSIEALSWVSNRMLGTPSLTAKAMFIAERVQNFRCCQPEGSGSSGRLCEKSITVTTGPPSGFNTSPRPSKRCQPIRPVAVMLGSVEPFRRNAMPTQIGENHVTKMLKANELVLCMGVNQLRTPNIATIAAARGFDAVYIDLEHNPTSLETAAGVCVAALRDGDYADRSGHLARPARRDPDSRLWRPGGSWCRMSRTP